MYYTAYQENRKQYSVVGIVSRLQTGQSRNQSSIPSMGKRFKSAQTDTGTHPVFYSVGSRGT